MICATCAGVCAFAEEAESWHEKCGGESENACEAANGGEAGKNGHRTAP